MTRSALFCLTLLAVLVVAFPAPRRESVQPSALSGVGGETDRALGGVPEAAVAQRQSADRLILSEAPGSNPGRGGYEPSGAPSLQPSPSSKSVHDAAGVTASGALGSKAAGSPSAVRSATASKKPLKRKEVRHDRPIPRVNATQPGRLLTGTASWFCLPGRSACTSGYPASGAYAAAGPRLRAALGDWRGRTVLVMADGVSVQVRLTDWCSCVGGYLLDLYASVFGQLARNGLGQGVVDVEVSW